MILTPTYHVFDLFKHHQNATLVRAYIETKKIGTETEQIDNISYSASISEGGTINLTIANLSADERFPMEIVLDGHEFTRACGKGISVQLMQRILLINWIILLSKKSPLNVTITKRRLYYHHVV